MTTTSTNWDRGRVFDWIREATGVGLWPNDPLPEILINKAQELGLEPADLRKWIYEGLAATDTRYAIITAAFEAWARPPRPICGYCGLTVENPQHQCPNLTQPAPGIDAIGIDGVCARCGQRVTDNNPEEHECPNN
jgi:hypothetical protein